MESDFCCLSGNIINNFAFAHSTNSEPLYLIYHNIMYQANLLLCRPRTIPLRSPADLIRNWWVAANNSCCTTFPAKSWQRAIRTERATVFVYRRRETEWTDDCRPLGAKFELHRLPLMARANDKRRRPPLLAPSRDFERFAFVTLDNLVGRRIFSFSCHPTDASVKYLPTDSVVGLLVSANLPIPSATPPQRYCRR